ACSTTSRSDSKRGKMLGRLWTCRSIAPRNHPGMSRAPSAMGRRLTFVLRHTVPWRSASTASGHGFELLSQPREQRVAKRSETGVIAAHEVVVLALDPVELLGPLGLAVERQRILERVQLVLFAVTDEERPWRDLVNHALGVERENRLQQLERG